MNVLLAAVQWPAFLSRRRLEAASGAAAEATRLREYADKVRRIQHDIRSPLTLLMALKQTIAHDKFALRALTVAASSIHAMVDALDFDESLCAHPKQTPVGVIVHEAAFICEAIFADCKRPCIDICMSVKESFAVAVAADRLKRVLVNLLKNAIEAGPIASLVTVRIAQAQDECRIEVQDEGPGVAPEIRPQLFAKGATFGKTDGLGLGLHSSRESARYWGGDLRLEPSELGALFVITLPLTSFALNDQEAGASTL